MRRGEKLDTLERVLMAVLALLHRKNIIKQEEVQLEILDQSTDKKGDNGKDEK